MRLLLKRWHYSMLRTILLTLTGALIASFILAFISNLTGFNNAFGGGLGGQCGASSVSWMTNLLGNIVTGVILVAAVILWLLFASSRFKHWMAGIGKDNPEDEKEPEPSEEQVIVEKGKRKFEEPEEVNDYTDKEPDANP